MSTPSVAPRAWGAVFACALAVAGCNTIRARVSSHARAPVPGEAARGAAPVRVETVVVAAADPPAEPRAPRQVVALRRVELASCHAPAPQTAGGRVNAAGDPRARAGAQRGLAFVAREASAWQEQHNCYGCHVQAVTLEALTVGRHHQYDVPQRSLEDILRGMLTLPGGARAQGGLSYHTTQLLEPSRAFGGAAFAHYDARVGSQVRADLITVAAQLRDHQQQDGSVGNYVNPPVAIGPLQTTMQAVQTWRQAHARTADERWLVPIRRAEQWLQARARELSDQPDAQAQHVNYAIMGLVSAGATGAEAVTQSLAARMRRLQNDDGGWGLAPRGPSNALVTGQTLYTLRLLGMTDQDATISRGTSWLLAHQAEDGGWSHAGSGKAEAMWAVLGLVSIDVLSLTVQGVEDGQHVRGEASVRATARDNNGAGVARMDVVVDDVPVHSVCGAEVAFRLDTSSLPAGVHSIDVVATNARGQTSRRRVEVYAGAYYLAEVGSRFEDNGTLVTLRNVAPRDLRNRVVLRVFATREVNGAPARGAEVYRADQEGAQGPMRFHWNGTGANGQAQPRGRYVAELAVLDAQGAALQTVELPFVHDTDSAQQSRYGEIAGALSADGAAPVANAQVDLVDARGNVVQSVTSTRAGQYRFRNVDDGNYRVRVRRAGFREAEAPAAARPRAAAAADINLQSH